MALATGLTIVKRFNYRGDPNEEWSNKYWFTGTPPNDTTTWKAFADAVIAFEKTCYTSGSEVIRVYGYNDDAPDADAFFMHDYLAAGATVPGTLAVGTDIVMAGDQAGTVYWKTSRKTSRGKWVYLRKYFHDATVSTGDTDSISLAAANAYAALAQKFADGTFQGRVVRSQKQQEVLQGWGRGPWVTTRTLKRRGRRPLATP